MVNFSQFGMGQANNPTGGFRVNSPIPEKWIGANRDLIRFRKTPTPIYGNQPSTPRMPSMSFRGSGSGMGTAMNPMFLMKALRDRIGY